MHKISQLLKFGQSRHYFSPCVYILVLMNVLEGNPSLLGSSHTSMFKQGAAFIVVFIGVDSRPKFCPDWSPWIPIFWFQRKWQKILSMRRSQQRKHKLTQWTPQWRTYQPTSCDPSAMQKYFPWVSYICDSGLSYDELVYILFNSVLGMKKEEIKKRRF